jgi:import receptor subunit TOM70
MAPGPVSRASTISAENSAVNPSNLSASSSASVWDRISKWASENKALVYTIAGVAVVVTGAGVVYYLSDTTRSGQTGDQSGEKRKSKKERRREKKKAEEEKRAEKAAPAAHSGMSSS